VPLWALLSCSRCTLYNYCHCSCANLSKIKIDWSIDGLFVSMHLLHFVRGALAITLLSDACIHSNAFASKLWLNVCKCDLLACPDNKWYSFQFSFSFSFFFVPAVCIHVWSRAARSPTRNPARPTNTRVNPFTICRRHNPDVRPQWAETAATDYRAVCRRSVVYHDRRPAFIER